MFHRPLLLGHRGARNYARENTLAAFELSLDHGCNGFEFDVRLTRDGEAVVVHDPMVAGVEVASSTRAELARAIGAPVAVLEDVFREFATRAYLNIELKVPGAETAIAALLRKYPGSRVMVSTFLADVVQRMHTAAPNPPLGYICDARNDLAAWRWLPVSHVVLHHSLLTQELASEIKASGKQVFVWTLNDLDSMERFAALKVDGIISDDTRLLGDTFREHRIAARA